jgi:hypothetical protein
MFVSLSDEQRRFVRTVRDLAQREFRPRARRYMDGTFLWENMHALAELGILGLAVPEESGGLGLPVFETALVLEEIAKTCYLDLSGQVEGRLVVGYARAAEEIGAELGDRHAPAAQVRYQAAVFLDRQAGFFVPPAANGGINNVTIRGPMEREPGATAPGENPASGLHNIPGLAGRRVGDFRSPEKAEAVTE